MSGSTQPEPDQETRTYRHWERELGVNSLRAVARRNVHGSVTERSAALDVADTLNSGEVDRGRDLRFNVRQLCLIDK